MVHIECPQKRRKEQGEILECGMGNVECGIKESESRK
jgi:hypothetical protein